LIYAKDHKTTDIFDPFSFLGPKRLKLLMDSWAGLFRQEVLPYLPVHLLSKHYTREMGRPTKELYAMMGIMILQQMKDLSDEETVRQFAFNIEWHYALGVTGESDTATYLCSRTLWNIRDLISKHALEGDIFAAIANQLATVADIDTDKQRLDSTHIFSNMKHLGRIGLFVNTIKGFLTNLKRNHKALYTTLDNRFVQHYMTKRGESDFAMVKPSESSRRLEDLGVDLFALVEQFKAKDQVTAMSSYHKLVRLLNEQCIIPNDGKGSDIEIKPDKEVASDSMQNPSDPDAGYDGYKGKGYQAQIMETYSEDEKTPCLITHVAVEPAHAHDAHALIPAIESAARLGLGPKEVLADSLYGSDENSQEAADLNVEVVSPVLGQTSKDKLSLDDFVIDTDGIMQSCPVGQSPERVRQNRKKNGHIAIFALAACAACPSRDICPSKKTKTGYRVRYTDKQARLAMRRAYEKTDEFRERYRWRAGVEGTNAFGKRTTGLGQLRVRGMKAVRFAVTMKWLGVNIMRVSKWKIAQNSGNTPSPAFANEAVSLILGCMAQIKRNMSRVFESELIYAKQTKQALACFG